MTRLSLGRLPAASGPTLAADPARRWTDPLVLLVFAVILVGSIWAVRTPQPGAPSETSADVGFARDMGDHHAQAVAMAEIARSKTEDPEIRTIATDVALTQQAQIGQMRGWLDTWGRPVAGRGDPMGWMGHRGTEMPGMVSTQELDDLNRATGAAADELFLRLMIRHHRGGLLMAAAAVAQADQDEVRTLARAIRDGQTAEIAAMSELLARMGAKPEPAAVTMPSANPADRSSDGPSVWRFTPVALVAGSVAWLLLDHRARRHTGRSTRRGARARREDGADWSELVLVLAGIAQLALALPAVLGARGDLTSAHTWRELGAAQIALGVGFLFSAVRPSRAAGLLPVAAALVVTSLGAGIIDVAQGHAEALTEVKHVVELVALGALAVLAHREPAGHPSAGTAASARPTLVEG